MITNIFFITTFLENLYNLFTLLVKDETDHMYGIAQITPS